MSEFIKTEKFKNINLNDPFFDSLKEDYPGFEQWFEKKSEESVYLFLNEQKLIDSFMYLKIEEEIVDDIAPILKEGRKLKIGTMKVNPHGTRLGERLIKKALDYALKYGCDQIYVTVFPKHDKLIRLFERYGFALYGKKEGPTGVENVYLKSVFNLTGNVVKDYPIIKRGNNKYLLGIHPLYHTRLFPDSILNNESFDIIEDVSHTNSIHKVYLTSMKVAKVVQGDVILIYRTSDNKGPARYRSVVTSVCVVEEVRRVNSFKSFEEFLSYCNPYSVFSDAELFSQFEEKHFVIKMTYNLALSKRVIRGILLDEVGINQPYWGFFELQNEDFGKILKLGGANERFIID
ncbi:N-acetyltransferase [Paenibacillus sp. Y412MC10]|uniref:GNAT family N-acetyltransferase n=1 Tax=Geobacillus sp. (strain Y412MC10) TaxID=481743 RepID=UPI0011A4A9DE|nr:GNAT family N-acetyltransferase [Paenibacillus sp. Y412MC10]